VTGEQYRTLIRAMARNAFKRRFPGIKQKEIDEVAGLLARSIHARFYGANVDNVDSPIWTLDRTDRINDTRGKPTVDASVLLEQG
jgi:hypothetical protein